jgi:hypothetical protein
MCQVTLFNALRCYSVAERDNTAKAESSPPTSCGARPVAAVCVIGCAAQGKKSG